MKRLKEQTKEQLAISERVSVNRILDKVFSYASGEDVEELIFDSCDGKGVVKFYSCGEKRGGLQFSMQVKKEIFSILHGLASPQKASVKGRSEFKKDSSGSWEVYSVSFYGKGDEERAIVSLSRGRYEVMSLRRLGFEKRTLGQVKEVLEGGKGAVLVISPFNSGKTTTLYSMVEYVNRPDVNVSTFEHQVKVDLPSVNQSQMSPGSNNHPLSSILRCDPDVVMMDELVEKEGVDAVLHLAERGYLVLAGLYGRDFPTTLDFLQGLGVDLPLFASSVKMIVNQRLVDGNCPNCLVKEKLSKDMKKEVDEILSENGLLDELKDCRAITSGVGSASDISFYKGAGCRACRQTGLSGKVGIFEVLSFDDDVKKMIREGHFSRLRRMVGEQGNLTLLESAVFKAVRGIIPLSEVLKMKRENEL